MFDVRKHDLAASADELKEQWSEQGYVVLDNAIDLDVIDRLNDDIDRLWQEPLGEGQFDFCGLSSDEGESINVKQVDCLQYDDGKRDYLKNNCNWRVHGMYDMLGSAGSIAGNGNIQQVVDLLIGQHSPVMASINFFKGSSQPLHQDQAVFHSYPLGKLIGCWIALEDIHPDSGPLLYYPGSHREQMYREFDDYPQTNLRTIDMSKHDDYYRYVYDIADRYEKHEFLAKKGQLLLWHAGLLHGGAKLNEMALTRKSYVMHYMPEECNYHTRVTGPFNW